eukprot:scaffold626_cov137-Pinguiococcus_pyrenoidosus.AAC.2
MLSPSWTPRPRNKRMLATSFMERFLDPKAGPKNSRPICGCGSPFASVLAMPLLSRSATIARSLGPVESKSATRDPLGRIRSPL